MKKLLFTLFISACYLSVFSQEPAYKKGTFYVLWGWNRNAYTNSTIHFTGDDYDFTLKKVVASDKPNNWSYHDFLQLDRITIPQTDLRIGYFIKDNLAITIGVDHMKYVMDSDQTVFYEGKIPAAYNYLVNGNTVKLAPEFLKYEHTDGLNYINAEIEYYKPIFHKGIMRLNGLVGGGAGFMLPKTNCTLMGNARHDAFHVAGYGLSAKIGLDADFWNVVFLRVDGKEGFINMPSVRTTKNSSDKASQNFFFGEFIYSLGVHWHF